MKWFKLVSLIWKRFKLFFKSKKYNPSDFSLTIVDHTVKGFSEGNTFVSSNLKNKGDK